MSARTVLNNDELTSDISAMRGLCDNIEKMVDTGQTWQDFCNTYHYNNSKLREFLRSLQPIKHAENKTNGTSYQILYGAWDYGLTQDEQIYKDIFQLNEHDLAGVKCVMDTGANIPEDFRETLSKIMDECLTEREQDIVNLRAEGYTFEAIGEKYQLTRERVRQLWQKSMERLRRPEYLRVLAVGYKQYGKDVAKRKKIYKNPVMVRDFKDLPSYNIPCITRAKRCIQTLGLGTVGEVEVALENGNLFSVKGFGKACEKSTRQGLNDLYQQYIKGEIA